MEEGPRRHRMTVEEYHRMAEVGLLASDERVELIEGEIIDMSPIGRRHAAAVSQLLELLSSAVGKRATIYCQSSIVLGDLSEPQPDFALLVRRDDFYRYRTPTAADTLLVIEVSETSLRYDCETKMPLYARHGIPELWVLDIAGKQLRVFRRPTGSVYDEVSIVDESRRLPIASLPGVEIDLSG
jgi:Uma2 family endonuclease